MADQTQNNTPVFSIVMPTYERPQMIKRAIRSVCEQTFSDFEIIVVNDGSTQSYANSFDEFKNVKLRIINNSLNLGVAQTRNTGILAATGKYISFLDDDDEYIKTFLESAYQKLHATPAHIGFAWTGVKYLNYHSEKDQRPDIKIREFATSYFNKNMLFEQLFSIGIGFGFTFKAECLKQCGLFNNRLQVVEDTDLFFRLVIAGFLPTIISNAQVVLHNHHHARLTNVSMHQKRIKECEWLLVEYSQFLDEYPTLRGQLLWQINHLKQELEVKTNSMAG